MKKSMLLVMAAVSVVSAIGVAAPLNKAQVPSGAKWVVHVDFDAFRVSQMGQLVKGEIEKVHQAKLNAMKELLGSDLSTDISGLTVYGPDANEANVVAMINGTFNRQKLLALLALNDAYGESEYNDQKLYFWRDDKKGKDQVGTFATDNLILISQTEDAVKGTLDVLAGRSAALAADKSTSLYGLTEGTQGAFVVAAADGLSDLVKDNEHAAVLQNSKMSVMIADEAQGQMRLFVQLEANSIEAAQQVEQMARGMLAFAMLQQEQHPELKPLLGACNLTRTDAKISFEFHYPSADLFAIAKQFAPKEM